MTKILTTSHEMACISFKYKFFATCNYVLRIQMFQCIKTLGDREARETRTDSGLEPVNARDSSPDSRVLSFFTGSSSEIVSQRINLFPFLVHFELMLNVLWRFSDGKSDKKH